MGFSRGYAAAEASGRTEVAGAGSRPDVSSAKVKLIGRDFEASEAVLADFKSFLKEHQLRFSEEDVQQNREPLARLIVEEVLRQVFGEGESKRRTLKWDPQFRRALEAAPNAERLLRDPQGFIAVRAAEARQAAPANNP